MHNRHPLTNAERQRRYRERNPERANAVRRKYRHDNSKWQTDAHYLSRPFVAWDGEGVTVDGVHKYVMLAGKVSGGKGVYVANPGGLSTAECFDTIIAYGEANPSAIHVIYGGGYDFNMMMRDLPRKDLERVYKNKFHVWNGYRIGWRPGKSFYVCRVDGDNVKTSAGITIYDTVSFFQCPFVTACDKYLGDKFTHREMIVSNKELRSSFTLDDIPTVKEYNDAELDNLLALMEELRSRLNKVSLRPRRWDGPGAVASALLQREGIKKSMCPSPEPVAKAARYAYSGGRFEVIKFGHVDEPVYEYDVNSAYPSALRHAPNLARGKWVRYDGDPGVFPFAMYHIDSTAFRPDIPGPLARRDSNGSISYPLGVVGWYWTPERVACDEYAARGYGKRTILEAWVFVPDDPHDKPFEFIEPLYMKRRALKKAGDGAHEGIKLALNSLYGKCAQSVGWEVRRDGTIRIPPFHQLEYAGYATSHCRAAVLTAALLDIESVIAFETDALFTSRPLPVDIGSNLGQWEEIVFSNLTYVQSGMYFGIKADGGAPVTKTRGVDRGQLERPEVLQKLGEPLAENRSAVAYLTRFVGAGIALMQGMHKWRRWERVQKRLTLEPTGKRIHVECSACEGEGISLGAWHETMCPMLSKEHSHQFPIPWVNPNPDMVELEELRMKGYEDDYE